MSMLRDDDSKDLKYTKIEKEQLIQEYRKEFNKFESKLNEVFKSQKSTELLDKLNSAAAPFLQSINSDFIKESYPFSEVYSLGSLKATSSFSTYSLGPDGDKVSSYHVNVGLDHTKPFLSFGLTSRGHNNNLRFDFQKSAELGDEDLERLDLNQTTSDELQATTTGLEKLNQIPNEDLQVIVNNIIKETHQKLADTAASLNFTMKGPDEDIKLNKNLSRQRYSDEDFRAIMSEKAKESYDRNLTQSIDDDLKAAIKTVDRLNLKLNDFTIIDNKFYGIATPTADPIESYYLIDCAKAKIFKGPDLVRTITDIKINPDTFDYSANVTITNAQEILAKKLEGQNPSPTLLESYSKALGAIQLLLDQRDLMLQDIVIINDRFYPVVSKFETDLNRVDDRYIVDPYLAERLPVQNFKDSLIAIY